MRHLKSFIILLSCLFSGILVAQEKRFALVIGNNSYEYASPLQNPVNDADAIAETLKLLGFEVLHFTNLDQKGMKQTIDLFGEKLKKFEVGLFYYSGHGIQVNGRNYLIPIDANLNSEGDAEYDCVDAGRVLSKMESSGTKTNIIVLDACRNNPYKKSWSRVYRKTGLAFLDAPTGSLIAYSTSPGNTASDGIGKNGLYTTFLLNSMINPDLNILQVFQEVRKNVRESSNGDQIPWESTSLESDFFFNQTGRTLTGINLLKTGNEKKPDEREILRKISEIKTDTSIIWFEAKGKILSETDKIAEEGFRNKLFSYLIQNIIDADPNAKISTIQEQGIQLLINEFDRITLRKVFEENKGSVVMRYLPKPELNLNLELKKSRISALIESGIECEKELSLADALKYYYWAYTLSLVFPGPLEGIVKDKNYNSIYTFLESKIKEVINSISFYATDSTLSEIYKSYRIKFYSNEKPLENVNIQFWNGVSWSEILYANNGTCIIEIYPSYSIKDVKLKVEYANIIESKFDPYLNKSLHLTFNDQFKNERSLTFHPEYLNYHSTISNIEKGVINALLVKLENKDLKNNNSLFTEQGFEIYKKLLVYGNASLFKIEDNLTSYSMGENSFIRSIPCTFNFQHNSIKFSENLCFELNAEGKIHNITFTLSDKAIKDIMTQERWPILSRQEIINFLENYKTAYALENIDYIEKIFSDNALIIVGQKIEVSESQDLPKFSLASDKYEFTKLTKEQYLYRLRNVFNKNEFINIRFEENIVKKRDNQSEVYGINIRQNYFSSNYADQGYLFLMVDMKDPEKPMIYVRSWQPLKYDNDNIINLSDFTY
jgi:hypothetical protein